MSFQLPSQRTSVAPRKRWAGAAFLVEAMLLLLFLVASMAIFTQLFAATAERANESRNLTDAVAIATSTAERFAANPADAACDEVKDGLRVICDVAPSKRDGGTIYYATISVYDAKKAGEIPVRTGGAADRSAASAGAPADDIVIDPAEDAYAGALANPASANGLLYTIQTAKYESGV